MSDPETEPTTLGTTLPPVRRQVVVTATTERAFDAWTSEIGTWWPLESHSVCGSDGTAAFVDGRLVETGPDGSSHLWGTVTAWEPGRRLTMTWHPGGPATSATTLDVQFDQVGEQQTVVTVTHYGWERSADLMAAREEYRTGWAIVAGRYANTLSEAPPEDEAGSVWLVLAHSVWEPGPGSVFADPRFAEHLAFLRRAQERGWLVAAGSLPDSPGAGMTVLRVPSMSLADAVAAAQDDDRSVAEALLGVHVRPWNVALTSQP